MKKYKTYLYIMGIILIIPIILKVIKNNHEVNYKVSKYDIEEKFSINEGIHNFNITIKNENEIYTYNLNKKLNKRKKIIKEIKTFKQENITCIIPIYKNYKETEIYCNEDKNQVSKYYLNNNNNYKKILKKAEKYKIKSINISNKKTKYKNINIYKDNIIGEESLIIWNYKGIYIIRNDSNKYQQFINYDLYDNIMNTMTSRYYVLFENTSVNGIEKIHCYDLKKDKYKVIELEEKISKESYINGVYKDKIYVSDKKNKVQYKIDIKKEKIEEVGNEELGYISNPSNEKDRLNKSDFFLEERYFNSKYVENENYSEVIENKDKYYFRMNNSFYEKINDNNILLFELENVKEWQVYNDDILLLKDDEIYIYNEARGLCKIAEYNELNYNYQNIIKLWK